MSAYCSKADVPSVASMPFHRKSRGVIRPQYGMIVGVADRDGERGAKTDAVFGAFDI